MDFGCEHVSAIREAELLFFDSLTVRHDGELSPYDVVLLLGSIRVVRSRHPRNEVPSPWDSTEVFTSIGRTPEVDWLRVEPGTVNTLLTWREA